MTMLREIVRSLLHRFGYDAMERDRLDLLRAAEQASETHLQLFRDIFRFYSATSKELHLLHLGANDGIKDDFSGFIRETPNVHSILVEPQSHCLPKLAQLQSANPRIRVLPVAFGETDGTATMYGFDRQREKDIQLDVFSSFDRAMLEQKRAYFGLSAQIVPHAVETCTLRTLLARGGAPRLDLLLCDIEGLDDIVIRQLLGTISPLPSVVVFEHRWLGDERRRAIYGSLRNAGYSILHGAEDAFCFRFGTT